MIETIDSPEAQASLELCRRIDDKHNAAFKQKFDIAIDFMEDRQIEHVRAELVKRFPSSFDTQDPGQAHQPVAIPLTERFVSEQANAYAKPPRRYFVDEAGAESDTTRAQTTALTEMLDECGYDDCKLQSERVSILLRTSCEWYGAKDGMLKVALVLPQDVYPVPPPTSMSGFDACCADDYDGFAVELHGRKHDDSAHDYVLMTPGGFAFYSGQTAREPGPVKNRVANPFAWDHGDGIEKPGQMLTFWHDTKPIGKLIPNNDASVADLNMELNIALSCLMDTLRFQGDGTVVLSLANSNSSQAVRRIGKRFGIQLGIGESAQALTFNIDYAGQISSLRELVRMMAVAKHMSPGEVSSDGVSPQSGFAKLVESLPKLERRDERIRALRRQEVRVARPRLLSIGVKLGKLDPSVWQMGYRVDFPDVEFPRTEQERSTQIETDIKNGLTTPAKILAKESGMSLEDAEAQIEENKATAPAAAPVAPQSFGGFSFGQRIGKRE